MNPVKISIRYCGKNVEDGAMPINDLVEALQGFSGAYDKILKHQNAEAHHVLKLTNIGKGSVDLLIQAYELIPDNMTIVAVGIGGAVAIKSVVKIVGFLIEITKHIHNQPYSVKVEGDNNVVIINKENSSLIIPQKIHDIYEQKIAATDISRLAAPLKEGEIDSGSIALIDEDGIHEVGKITFAEKEYFDPNTYQNITTKQITLTGKMLSHHKETNNGRFIYGENEKVLYHLAMLNPENFYHFYIYKGVVMIKGVGHYDNLKLVKIDVYEITQIQHDMFGENDNNITE